MELYTTINTRTALMKLDRKRHWVNSDVSLAFGNPDIHPVLPHAPAPPSPPPPAPPRNNATRKRKRASENIENGCQLDLTGHKKQKIGTAGNNLPAV